MLKTRIIKILDILQKDYPHATTMLKYNTKFELLVAIVLSAQSTDEQVNNVTKYLFAKYNTPEDLANIDIEELEGLIKGVGIYRNKAKNIKALAKIIYEDYNNEIPDTLEELITLPGVGRKTANVMLAVGFNKPGLGVDTHVVRVVNRLGIVATKNPTKIELSLKENIPPDRWGEAHHLLIYHGRNICKARKPNCQVCSIIKYCEQIID